jgi:hypothetical protein
VTNEYKGLAIIYGIQKKEKRITNRNATIEIKEFLNTEQKHFYTMTFGRGSSLIINGLQRQ